MTIVDLTELARAIAVVLALSIQLVNLRGKRNKPKGVSDVSRGG